MLKQKLYFAAASLVAMMLVSTSAQAQYDDMYYDPDNFRSVERAPDYSNQEQSSNFNEDDYRSRTSERYADDDYYDYYYTSRIRRFNRPYTGFGYYDPVYVDMAYYDPFFRPAGTTVLIYNDFNRSFYRPVRTAFGVRYINSGAYAGFNRGWGGAYGAFGWNDPFLYGRAYNPVVGAGYGNPFGYGRFGNSYGAFGGGAFGGPAFGGGGYYCPPAWGGGNTYAVPNDVSNARTVSNTPRAATTSIADRVERARRNAAVSPRSIDGTRSAAPARTGQNTRTVGRTRSVNDTRSIDRTRTTVAPRSANSRSASPQRAVPSRSNPSYTPSRTTTPTRRAVPSRSNSGRSYTPSRSATPQRSVTPSRSASPQRSYTPSRSSTPSRSVTPSRSSTPSRSATPSRSSTPSRRGGGGE
ncbi:hypothetical protein [Lewinella sp. IMCC34183]|uniref:hypothetical protein n=1 Tax=Lewinella sp. IMCC34183 TaxID=2248762 RepID=UPI000E270D5C|nr:hypothetical protein [Lewinella sp. IMCC34183]